MVRQADAISRKELASLSGLSLATTKRIVENLLHENLVIETGTHKSKRGKRTQLLSLNPDFGYSLGVNLYQNAIELTAISLAGIPIYEETCLNEGKEKNTVIENIKRAITSSLNSIQRQTSAPLLGIGVGLPATG